MTPAWTSHFPGRPSLTLPPCLPSPTFSPLSLLQPHWLPCCFYSVEVLPSWLCSSHFLCLKDSSHWYSYIEIPLLSPGLSWSFLFTKTHLNHSNTAQLPHISIAPVVNDPLTLLYISFSRVLTTSKEITLNEFIMLSICHLSSLLEFELPKQRSFDIHLYISPQMYPNLLE